MAYRGELAAQGGLGNEARRLQDALEQDGGRVTITHVEIIEERGPQIEHVGFGGHMSRVTDATGRTTEVQHTSGAVLEFGPSKTTTRTTTIEVEKKPARIPTTIEVSIGDRTLRITAPDADSLARTMGVFADQGITLRILPPSSE